MSIDHIHQKISADHLQRDAFLYVRQSSLRQVLENTESKQRQYALRDRAVALGWPIERVHVIDNDQGRSGATAEHRDGFQYLVTEVALGHAGIVLGLEISRLARNNADWHRLIELAALAHTLILDEDGIYDPAHFNDRLLLGLKGTMSEAELHVLRARLIGGQRSKARRGELKLSLPIGLLYGADDAIILDPDQQIQYTVRWIFETFRQTRAATRVIRRFRQEGLQFPRRIHSGTGKGEVLWGPLNHSRVVAMLHNPRYAGAYVYGRSRSLHNAQMTTSQIRLPREQWLTCIPDAHVGYIAWEEFERNQETLHHSATTFSMTARGSMPREGIGLLQGRVLCGLCGARMRVRYQRVKATLHAPQRLVPYYQCTEALVRYGATRLCQSIRGNAIDTAISTLLLETIAPAALEVALAVQDEIAVRIEEAEKLRRLQLERAHYEAELARRRYLKVDPDNRLVADNLEADWNERLRRLNDLTLAQEQQRQTDQGLLNEQARERILALANDFPHVWNDPNTPVIERKRMVALLIEDVTLVRADEIAVHVRWRGGQTTSLTVERPKPMALVRKTKPEVIQAIDQLLETCTDVGAAKQLNALGHRTWQQRAFTNKSVRHVRKTYHLKSLYQRLRAKGFLTAPQLAKQLGVSVTIIHTWGRAGRLCRQSYGDRRCLYAPIKDANMACDVRSQKPAKVVRAQSSTQETV